MVRMVNLIFLRQLHFMVFTWFYNIPLTPPSLPTPLFGFNMRKKNPLNQNKPPAGPGLIGLYHTPSERPTGNEA